jgi:DNA-binding SARP family transcriptional activator/tetratricopeptide (TPR) repeat protein
LLGAPRVILDGVPISFDTRKAIALLAYLAVSGQPQQRDALAALLWPDADGSHARGALRRTLSVLHSTLHRTPLLQIERDQVALRLGPDARCDVRAFCELAAPAAGRTTPDGADIARLERAAALYQDHFMAGFSLRDSAAYDDWQFFEGEELRRTLAQVLETLVTRHTARHNWPQAITHARRRLALDTLHEPAHRQLMLLFAWSDQRAAALRQYGECRRILQAELGVPPLAETTNLYEAILNHQPPPAPPRLVDGGAESDAGVEVESGAGAGGSGTGGPNGIGDEAAGSGYPAGDAGDAREQTPASPEPQRLVGRSRQWEALRAAWACVGAQGHLVVIEGEAGAGKTALAQAFLAQLRREGTRSATGTCYSGEETLAYAPVEQMLRQALEDPEIRAALGRIEAPWQQALGRLLPEYGATHMPGAAANAAYDQPASQAQFLEGIARTSAGLLQGAHPGAILLDDLQYADGATLDLLAYMVRRLQTLPLLILVTWRSNDVPPHHRLRQVAAEAARRQAVTVLTLPPLDEPAILELVSATRGLASADPGALAARLFGETKGLPLFVAEYLELLRRGVLDAGAGNWPAPQGVREFLHARMAGLSETAQQIASTAAVIGRAFDTETVIAVSGRSEDEGVNALEELLARRLILEQGANSLDFAHAQLRSLIYEEISQVRRRLLHRRVADELVTSARRSGIGAAGVAAALAYHYELGGVPHQAAQWAVTAGEHARQLYANREAISYFENALTLGAEDTCTIHLHLGDLHTLQGEYAQALESYRLAQAACHAQAAAQDGSAGTSPAGSQAGSEAGSQGGGSPRLRAGEIEHRLGRLHHRLGDNPGAVRHFAAALDYLTGATANHRPAVLADWSLAAYAMQQTEEAERLAQEALNLVRAGSDGDGGGGGDGTAARAYDILSLVARRRNELPVAVTMAVRSLHAARSSPDPAAEIAALNSLALAHAAGGDLPQAIPLLQEALDLCLRLGDRHREAALRNNLADLYHAGGEHDAAMHQLKQAVAIFAEVGAEAGPENADIWMLSEW